MIKMSNAARFWRYFRLVTFRVLLPILILFWFGGTVATILDKNHVKAQPTDEFLKYTAFTVQGAYEGENVNFTVCREFDYRYRYSGDLKVFIIPEGSSQGVPVYSRPINSTLNKNPCEAKVLAETDYHHLPGGYRMSFRVCVKVKYGIEKCTEDVESNVYRIRAKPTDLQGQIEYYQALIKQLQSQQEINQGCMAPVTTPQNQPITQKNADSVNTTQNNSGEQKPTTREVCTINLLGIKVNCRQEPL